MKQWTETECRERNRTEPRIHEGWNCQWVAPYGWVPEAGCPVHDVPAATNSTTSERNDLKSGGPSDASK